MVVGVLIVLDLGLQLCCGKSTCVISKQLASVTAVAEVADYNFQPHLETTSKGR